jgi:acetyltransferase
VGACLAAVEPAVVLRPVRPQDSGAFAGFIENLSVQSRRRRFHGAVAQLPPDVLHRFTHPDPGSEQAWLAFALNSDGGEFCVGEARYATPDDGPADAREFALAVADHWQGRGIGAALLHELTAQASRRRVQQLHGDVLRDNLAMLALAQRQGFVVSRHPTDARLLRVTRQLDQAIPWNAAWCAGASAAAAAAAWAA